jgi:heme exporter protein B
MNPRPPRLAKLWWIIQKDLVCEYRTHQAWPRMMILGLVVAFLLSYQMVLPPAQLQQVAASLCWVTLCFAAVLTLGQSIAMEREEGCWEGLLLYPVAPATIFLAKLIVNAIILGLLQLVIVPFFAIVSGAPWLSRSGQLLLISLLGNLGISSLGTLLAALAAGLHQSQGLLALLLLPLLVPVIIAASEATRLIDAGQSSWQWLQLLAAFAIVYVTVGWVLFAHVGEG